MKAEEKAGQSVVPKPELQQNVMSIAGKDGTLAGSSTTEVVRPCSGRSQRTLAIESKGHQLKAEPGG